MVRVFRHFHIWVVLKTFRSFKVVLQSNCLEIGSYGDCRKTKLKSVRNIFKGVGLFELVNHLR